MSIFGNIFPKNVSFKTASGFSYDFFENWVICYGQGGKGKGSFKLSDGGVYGAESFLAGVVGCCGLVHNEGVGVHSDPGVPLIVYLGIVDIFESMNLPTLALRRLMIRPAHHTASRLTGQGLRLSLGHTLGRFLVQ